MQYGGKVLSWEMISGTINLNFSVFKCLLIGLGNKTFHFHHNWNKILLKKKTLAVSFNLITKINMLEDRVIFVLVD